MGIIKDLIGLTVAESAAKIVDAAISPIIDKHQKKKEKEKLALLKELKELYDSGAITEKEYNKKKKKIMKEMK